MKRDGGMSFHIRIGEGGNLIESIQVSVSYVSLCGFINTRVQIVMELGNLGDGIVGLGKRAIGNLLKTCASFHCVHSNLEEEIVMGYSSREEGRNLPSRDFPYIEHGGEWTM